MQTGEDGERDLNATVELLGRAGQCAFEVKERVGDGDRLGRHRRVLDTRDLGYRPAPVAGIRGVLPVSLGGEEQVGARACVPAVRQWDAGVE
jgi:hypothetical protein